MAEALMILADGFEEAEAIIPLDFLRRAEVGIVTTGSTTRTVKGSHGINIETDMLLEEVDAPDSMLILPGGRPGADNLAADARIIDLIRSCHNNGTYIAAICAAPALVLQKAGVLKGRRATCYPGFESRFTDTRYSTDTVVQDGNIITSRGVGTASEFALKLIALLRGAESAEEIAAKVLL